MAKYTKQKDGRYHSSVWDGTFIDGKKHYVSLVSKNVHDLDLKMDEIKRKREAGALIVTSSDTVIDYARKWIKVNKSVREKATYAMYENIIEHKLGMLGTVPLASITHSALQGQINEISDSPRTCQIFLLTFKQIIKAAEKDRILPRGSVDDICGDIQLPRYKAKERRALTEYEKEAILAADFTPMERALVLILYSCGLRREEALALSRFDINLRGKTISVNKALGFDKNNGYIKSTKSANGVRVVPLPKFCADHLQVYISTLETPELFPRAPGVSEYMTKTIYVRMWARIIKKMKESYIKKYNPKFADWDTVGIQSLTAHIFRHNYCTQLCYESVSTGSISTKKIAAMLGDSEAMVLRVYSHVLEEREQAAKAVSSALDLKKKSKASNN